MPWTTSDRASRLPKDWHARRAACYRRAGGRCQWLTNGQRCTTVTPLHRQGHHQAGHADHIDRTLGDDPTNLQWLCPPHHLAKSSAEGNQARRTQRTDEHHPRERHPGLA
jgi:5-methylcytosine-specific restriction protein A